MLDTDYPYFPDDSTETRAKAQRFLSRDTFRARVAAFLRKLRDALRCRRSAL